MSEAEQDLDIAIGHYAELLASNLHAQRAAHFPPDAKKVMRSLTSGEAAELLGVDHTYLRKLHREGKIADVETTAGSHRRYTLMISGRFATPLRQTRRSLEPTFRGVVPVTSFRLSLL